MRDVQIVETIAVEIADRHAVMPHAPRHEDGVEMRRPVIERRNELPAKRGNLAERRAGDFSKDRRGRATAQVVDRDPFGHAPAVGCVLPAHLPVPEPLRAPAPFRGAAQIEPHGRADSWIVRTFLVDSRDQELGSLDGLEVCQQRAQLFAERGWIERQILADCERAEDFELRAVAGSDLTQRQ